MDKSAETVTTTDEPGARRPLHRRIADDLRDLIVAGDLRPGDLLPSEHDLMARYGVSRGTVRQARAALLAEGSVDGSQGKHFSVRGPSLTQPLDHLVSFTAWAASLGRVPSGCTVSYSPAAAEEDEAEQLGIAPGSAVWRLVRVRMVDGEPVMVERTSFPEPVGRLLAGLDLAHGSVYAELQRLGRGAAAARHLIDAVPAEPDDAALLEVSVGTPLLRVRRTGLGADGAPIEYSDDRYRGDRTNFAIENTAAAGVARRLA